MSVTIIYGDRTMTVASATTDGGDLWLSLDDLRAATGWELKPQGVCQGEVCVPIPVGHESEFVRADGQRFNLAALARRLNQPAVNDDEYAVWFFGEANAGEEARQSLLAPDFTLPNIDGRSHSLSEYRGRKILLFSWASW
ncbi:MAG: redoxin domain-containing protein [Blastocatellia bacterium]|nr:redoxin domain-containing protein [Blastocatellia bacterium]